MLKNRESLVQSTKEGKSLSDILDAARRFVSVTSALEVSEPIYDNDDLDKAENDLNVLLDRNTPWKPKRSHEQAEDGYLSEIYECGCCGRFFTHHTYNFCPFCGQKIDWRIRNDRK